MLLRQQVFNRDWKVTPRGTSHQNQCTAATQDVWLPLICRLVDTVLPKMGESVGVKRRDLGGNGRPDLLLSHIQVALADAVFKHRSANDLGKEWVPSCDVKNLGYRVLVPIEDASAGRLHKQTKVFPFGNP